MIRTVIGQNSHSLRSE